MEESKAPISFSISPSSPKDTEKVNRLRQKVYTELSELYPTTRFEVDGDKIYAIPDKTPENRDMLEYYAERIAQDVVKITWEFFEKEDPRKKNVFSNFLVGVLRGFSVASTAISVALFIVLVVLFTIGIFSKG